MPCGSPRCWPGSGARHHRQGCGSRTRRRPRSASRSPPAPRPALPAARRPGAWPVARATTTGTGGGIRGARRGRRRGAWGHLPGGARRCRAGAGTADAGLAAPGPRPITRRLRRARTGFGAIEAACVRRRLGLARRRVASPRHGPRCSRAYAPVVHRAMGHAGNRPWSDRPHLPGEGPQVDDLAATPLTGPLAGTAAGSLPQAAATPPLGAWLPGWRATRVATGETPAAIRDAAARAATAASRAPAAAARGPRPGPSTRPACCSAGPRSGR